MSFRAAHCHVCDQKRRLKNELKITAEQRRPGSSICFDVYVSCGSLRRSTVRRLIAGPLSMLDEHHGPILGGPLSLSVITMAACRNLKLLLTVFQKSVQSLPLTQWPLLCWRLQRTETRRNSGCSSQKCFGLN